MCSSDLIGVATCGETKKADGCPRDSIRKVKSAMSKGNKSGVMGKASAAA